MTTSSKGDNNEDFTSFITKELAGTKTEKNLKDAYCGESKARNNYTFFASQAEKEGYRSIAEIFQATAENERQHAKIWFKLLNGGKLLNTLDNLKTAAETESYEWEDMYAQFAKDAREEGFEEIACLFEKIRTIEKMHMTRYRKIIKELENKTLLKKASPKEWECEKCGYHYEGLEPPEQCPFCRHPQNYFFVVEKDS